MKCLYFIDLTIFRGQGRNSYNNFVGFLVEMMPSKSPFEINWPLSSIEFGKSFNLLCVTYISFVVRHYNWANLLLIFFSFFFAMELQKSAPAKYWTKLKWIVALKYFVIKCMCQYAWYFTDLWKVSTIFALEKCPTSGRIWLNNKYCDYLIHGHGATFSKKIKQFSHE